MRKKYTTEKTCIAEKSTKKMNVGRTQQRKNNHQRRNEAQNQKKKMYKNIKINQHSKRQFTELQCGEKYRRTHIELRPLLPSVNSCGTKTAIFYTLMLSHSNLVDAQNPPLHPLNCNACYPHHQQPLTHSQKNSKHNQPSRLNHSVSVVSTTTNKYVGLTSIPISPPASLLPLTLVVVIVFAPMILQLYGLLFVLVTGVSEEISRTSWSFSFCWICRAVAAVPVVVST